MSAPTIQTIAAMLLIAGCLLIVIGLGIGQKKSERTQRRRTSDQLDKVMRATFTKARVMSPSEYRVFKIVENEVAAAGRGHRVFAQTSLGEV